MMMTTTDYEIVQKCAELASGCLERRAEPREGYPICEGCALVTKDGSPDWLTDLCHAAHKDGSPGIGGERGTGSQMPNDWRYEFIDDALDAIAENEDADAARDSIWSDGAYPYIGQQIHWLHSRVDRLGYCEQFIDEYGSAGMDASVGRSISGGMLMERLEVFDSVFAWLEENAEDILDD